ncbi:MAG: hypothetical protein HY015_07195 [Bacteroidetes bacterium]|nr:hypothetical protein [Bacteroidota bacterium]MBI3482748.1 hypothetical protein [Bacteroidota bacterium]
MSELIVNISPTIKKKYRISGNRINFNELEEKIRLANARDRLDRVVKIAKETGLSKMTNKEINQIIKRVRENARSSR